MMLREYRRINNLTLAKFGEMVGRSPATISRIERGLDRPSWETLDRIEKATDGKVTVADIRAAA